MASVRVGTRAELGQVYATGTPIDTAFIGDDVWEWDPSSSADEDDETVGPWDLGRWRLRGSSSYEGVLPSGISSNRSIVWSGSTSEVGQHKLFFAEPTGSLLPAGTTYRIQAVVTMRANGQGVSGLEPATVNVYEVRSTVNVSAAGSFVILGQTRLHEGSFGPAVLQDSAAPEFVVDDNGDLLLIGTHHASLDGVTANWAVEIALTSHTVPLATYGGTGTPSAWATIQRALGADLRVTDHPYRAIPDGTTDCTAAIQACLDDAAASGVGVFFDRPGTYVCGAVRYPSNTHMYGLGMYQVTLKMADGTTKFMFANSDVTGGNERAHFHDFKIDGNSENNVGGVSGALLGCANINDVLVERVWFHDAYLDGFYAGDPGLLLGAVGGVCSKIIITHCKFTFCGRNGMTLSRADETSVTHNHFTDCNWRAHTTPEYHRAATIDLEPNNSTMSAKRIDISHNVLERCHYAGITMHFSNVIREVSICFNKVGIVEDPVEGANGIEFGVGGERVSLVGNHIYGWFHRAIQCGCRQGIVALNQAYYGDGEVPLVGSNVCGIVFNPSTPSPGSSHLAVLGNIFRNVDKGFIFNAAEDISGVILDDNFVLEANTFLQVASGSSGSVLGVHFGINYFNGDVAELPVGLYGPYPHSRALMLGTHVESNRLTAHLTGTATWSQGSVAAGAIAEQTIPVTGALVGDTPMCTYSLALPAGLQWLQPQAVDGGVKVALWNPSAGPLDPGAGDVRVSVWRHS